MKKQKLHSSTSHSLSPSPHTSQGPYSTHTITKDSQPPKQDFDSQIYQFNFKVLSRQPTLRNLHQILLTLPFVNLAKYQINGNYWNYLKVKGPMFLVQDKYNQIKLAILNQCSTQNQVIHIQKQMKFQLQKLANQAGYMLNYCIEDSITGKTIFGIWTADKNIQKVHHQIDAHLNANKI